MRKTLMIFALCIASAAMAQTTPTTPGKFSDSLPKLPPLKVDFESVSLFHHYQPGLLLMPHENKDSLDTLSIMFRHKEHNSTSQFHYKSTPDYKKMVDNLGVFRDQIVRKRRKDEGRPLQPLPPPSMRR
jgi:hypothetical protein